ncbi:MAG: hypothetical protein L0216_21270 [Planctomycetales bacterium]|nr:hypothetical protein [Planctomycetales bacterium]
MRRRPPDTQEVGQAVAPSPREPPSQSKTPRVVIVTRKTEYEQLLERHATQQQAQFFLQGRQQNLSDVEARHRRFEAALRGVLQAVPAEWRRARVDRGDLDRFLFEPEDLVVAVGQDGLVANAAKYLAGQTVIGLNPDPERYEGVLVPHPPGAAGDLLATVVAGRAACEARTMVEAELDDGQRILALNEVFVGHRTHQSARYVVSLGDRSERQSSSGLIVATGTGATGWARSIHRERKGEVRLPRPADRRLAFFVREAWPSVATGTTLTEGLLGEGEALGVTSEMNEDGVIFGDGIEGDRLEFLWGRRVAVRVAPSSLNLMRG